MQVTGIPAAELAARRETLLEHVRSNELTGYVLFGEDYIQYFTSFGFLATERPVAFAANASGDMAVFVPEFEVERVRAETEFERVESYPEYPGVEHPMQILARVLADMGIAAPSAPTRTAIRASSATQGPALSEVTGQRVAAAGAVHREHDGPQERGRGGADPRERPLVRARAPAAAGVHAAGGDRGRGQPAGRPRGDARHARDARRAVRRPAGVVGRRVGRVPRPDRAQELVGARGGPQHRVPGGRRPRHGDERARSGATTPSSSAR